MPFQHIMYVGLRYTNPAGESSLRPLSSVDQVANAGNNAVLCFRKEQA